MNADAMQIILVAVIVVLTVVLVGVGIQIFLVLKQSNETLRKVNKILDGASGIVGNSAIFNNPLVKILAGTALAFLAGKKKIENKEKSEIKVQKPRLPVRRFFKRSTR